MPGAPKSKPSKHEGHDISPAFQGRFDLAPQPVSRFLAALQGGRRQQDKEVRPRRNISQDHAFEIAACDAVVVEEYIEAVICKILKNCKRPWDICAAIAEKDGFFDAFHASDSGLTGSRIEQYQKPDAVHVLISGSPPKIRPGGSIRTKNPRRLNFSCRRGSGVSCFGLAETWIVRLRLRWTSGK